MRDNVLLTFIGVDVLFAVSGGLLIIFALLSERENNKTPAVNTIAQGLILGMCPLKAAIGNAALVFVTFLFSIPAIILPMTRGWLKLSGYMTVICALYTMVLGLTIWFETLKMRSNLFTIWNQQPASTQSLIQQNLKCCGYMNSTSPPFVVDNTCTNSLVAEYLGGCVTPFSTYGNNFLDIIFTGAFGIVGIDVLLVIVTAIILKDRKEKERYRHIDEKNGTGTF